MRDSSLAGPGQRGRRVREVAPGHREHPVAHPERVEGGQVLRRLRHPRVVRRDHEERDGHRTHPGQRRGQEALVSRHVDEGHVTRAVEVVQQ